jgi:hypothetical protein
MKRAEGAARRVTRVLRCAFCLLLISSSSCSRSSGPVIHLDTTERNATSIEVTGLSRADLMALSRANLSADEWSALLRVTLRSSTSPPGDDALAMAGRYTVEGSLRFSPSFPFDAGREYDVRFDPSRVSRAGLSAHAVTATISIPDTNRSPSTRVSAVHPGSDRVPENLLRMYVVFSKPMGQQGGRDHIAFFDDSGREVPDVVVPLDTDLWNTERTRYTVILDPGRVKREIQPNREMGRALHDGAGLTLVVKRDWPDAHGLPLASEFRHRFRIGPAEEHALSTAQWRVAPPAAGTRDPVTVTFPKPLDFGLLQRSLSVRRGDSSIAGSGRVGPAEIWWQFVPDSEWQRGPYMLKVEPVLEDVAGNRIGRAFEVLSRGDAVPPESSLPVFVPFIAR